MMIEIARQAAPRQQTAISAILLGLLVVDCLASDFLMMPALAMMPRRPILGFPLLMASVGCVLAQGCLLAAWLAWSDQPFGQRLLRHWIIAAILFLVWAAGLALGLPNRFAPVSSMVGLSVPLVSIAAQLPLWIARQTFGWRLIRGDANNDTGARPLSIRDLMLATVLVALALAPARWVPSPDGKEIGTPWFVIILAATTISTITLLPTSPLLLRTRRFQHGVLFACLYAAFWMALPWVVFLIARNRGLFAPPPVAVLVGLSCLVLSFAATAILAATAVRARGYRLAWGRSPRRSGGF
jgi:hypothetical protein